MVRSDTCSACTPRGHLKAYIMQLSLLSPRRGGGGKKVTTPGKLTYKAVPWVGILNIHGALII